MSGWGDGRREVGQSPVCSLRRRAFRRARRKLFPNLFRLFLLVCRCDGLEGFACPLSSGRTRRINPFSTHTVALLGGRGAVLKGAALSRGRVSVSRIVSWSPRAPFAGWELVSPPVGLVARLPGDGDWPTPIEVSPSLVFYSRSGPGAAAWSPWRGAASIAGRGRGASGLRVHGRPMAIMRGVDLRGLASSLLGARGPVAPAPRPLARVCCGGRPRAKSPLRPPPGLRCVCGCRIVPGNGCRAAAVLRRRGPPSARLGRAPVGSCSTRKGQAGDPGTERGGSRGLQCLKSGRGGWRVVGEYPCRSKNAPGGHSGREGQKRGSSVALDPLKEVPARVTPNTARFCGGPAGPAAGICGYPETVKCPSLSNRASIASAT